MGGKKMTAAGMKEDSARTSFASMVYELTAQIPPGKVSTYGAIAKGLGRPQAARAVGRILGANPHPIIVPCHRVVRSDGSLGGYSMPRGVEMKAELLLREGVDVRDGTIGNFSRALFTDFQA